MVVGPSGAFFFDIISPAVSTVNSSVVSFENSPWSKLLFAPGLFFCIFFNQFESVDNFFIPICLIKLNTILTHTVHTYIFHLTCKITFIFIKLARMPKDPRLFAQQGLILCIYVLKKIVEMLALE